MQISQHFKRSEFACNCGCGFDTVDVELIAVLEDLRQYFNSAVIITGPNRCSIRNANTPGSSFNSLHMYGKAADVVVTSVTPAGVYQYLDSKYPDKYGIGLYDKQVHIDIRTRKARWNRQK